jgi:hypothetical protein
LIIDHAKIYNKDYAAKKIHSTALMIFGIKKMKEGSEHFKVALDHFNEAI